MNTKAIRLTVFTVLSVICIVVMSYMIMVNIPYQKKRAGMEYYTYVEQRPSFREKQALKVYCRENGFNTNLCILVNYSIPSGKPRFFVYDFNKKRIVYRSKCAHGLGGGSTAHKPVFSNSNGSRCSSLGKFVIAGMGSAHYRNCFRLKGLDKSNSNAEQRGILIHSASIVSRFKYLPWMPLGKSCEGCFTISKSGLLKLHEIYNEESNKNILVYSYTS